MVNKIIAKTATPKILPDQSLLAVLLVFLPTSLQPFWIPGTSTLLAKRVLNNTPLAITAPIKLIHNTVERFLLGKVTNKKIPNKSSSITINRIVPLLFFPLFATILAPFATKIPIPKNNVNPIKLKTFTCPPHI